MKQSNKKPTDAELDILQILWNKGASTVREIHEALQQYKGTTYTTTLKIMQRMHEKGLLKRDETGRQHLYTATHKAEQTQSFLLKDLLSRAFGGSSAQLVMRALSSKQASKEELNEIQKVIDKMKEDQS